MEAKKPNNPMIQDFLHPAEWYEEDAERTMRVGGGTPILGLAKSILYKLADNEYVDLVAIGGPPTWQMVQAVALVQKINPETVKVNMRRVMMSASKGPRKSVVTRLTRTGDIVSLQHFNEDVEE